MKALTPGPCAHIVHMCCGKSLGQSTPWDICLPPKMITCSWGQRARATPIARRKSTDARYYRVAHRQLRSDCGQDFEGRLHVRALPFLEVVGLCSGQHEAQQMSFDEQIRANRVSLLIANLPTWP